MAKIKHCFEQNHSQTKSATWLVVLSFSILFATETVSANDRVAVDSHIKRINLIQPISVSKPKSDDSAKSPPINLHDLRIAAKWRTNLLIPTDDASPAAPITKKNTTARKIAKQNPEPESSPLQEEPQIPDPVAEVEIIETPKTNEFPKTIQQQESSCYTPSKITSLSVNIDLPSGKLPADKFTECDPSASPTSDSRLFGGWAMFDYHWSSAGLCHRPLYFEEVNAERYGYTRSYVFQPVISAVRFFATIPALPYKMAVDCPRDCIYTLGHYRPGSCNPWRNHRLPFRLGAAVVETGFVAGLILLIP